MVMIDPSPVKLNVRFRDKREKQLPRVAISEAIFELFIQFELIPSCRPFAAGFDFDRQIDRKQEERDRERGREEKEREKGDRQRGINVKR